MRGAARKTNKKKTAEKVKKELLALLVENSDGEGDYLESNEEVRIAKEPLDGTDLVKKYEGLLRGTSKKIINIIGKQGELLKRFRDKDEFFDRVGLSRLNIYFKISLYKFLNKSQLLKNSTLTSSYFKTNVKLIKKLVN